MVVFSTVSVLLLSTLKEMNLRCQRIPIWNLLQCSHF